MIIGESKVVSAALARKDEDKHYKKYMTYTKATNTVTFTNDTSINYTLASLWYFNGYNVHWGDGDEYVDPHINKPSKEVKPMKFDVQTLFLCEELEMISIPH